MPLSQRPESDWQDRAMLAPTREHRTGSIPSRRTLPPMGGGRPSGPTARRLRRVALLTALLLALPAMVSYASMLTQRSDSSLSVRTVEWLRDNGARGLVNRVENSYSVSYTNLTQP